MIQAYIKKVATYNAAGPEQYVPVKLLEQLR